jgi:hypothetical protein
VLSPRLRISSNQFRRKILLAALQLLCEPSGGDETLMLAPFEFEAPALTSNARTIEVLLVEDNPVNQELADAFWKSAAIG